MINLIAKSMPQQSKELKKAGSHIIKNSNVGEDTAIGIIFSSFFALGFILISVLNVTINLEDLLFGQILAVSRLDVFIVIAMCIAVVSLVIIFFKGITAIILYIL